MKDLGKYIVVAVIACAFLAVFWMVFTISSEDRRPTKQLVYLCINLGGHPIKADGEVICLRKDALVEALK